MHDANNTIIELKHDIVAHVEIISVALTTISLFFKNKWYNVNTNKWKYGRTTITSKMNDSLYSLR